MVIMRPKDIKLVECSRKTADMLLEIIKSDTFVLIQAMRGKTMSRKDFRDYVIMTGLEEIERRIKIIREATKTLRKNNKSLDRLIGSE